eukprot:g13813.t1
MSSTVVSAVEAITTARSSTALDADINDLVAHVAKGSYSLAAVLSAKSRGAPSSYEAAVLQNVLDATESSCPLQGSNNMYDDGDRTTKKGNKDKNKTTAAAASSHSDCATKHDECMASCSSGGLFSRGKTPAAGTCTLVCTVLQEGCKRPGATLDISSMPVATVVEEVEEVACRPRPGAAMMNISSMPVGTVVEEVEEEATVALPVAVGVAVSSHGSSPTGWGLAAGLLTFLRTWSELHVDRWHSQRPKL